MRILAPGPIDRQRGFTLLEMMVVLLIIGIATGMATVSAFGGGQRQLQKDALRLGQLFALAQAHARASGQTLIWTHDERGFAFVRPPQPLLLPPRIAARVRARPDPALKEDSPLRARRWLSEDAVTVRVTPAGTVRFGPDWLPGPLHLELISGERRVQLSRLGNGQYVVGP